MKHTLDMKNAFVMQRRVEFMDTDMAGIVHFTAFFRYMETAEHELLHSIGLSITSLHRERGLGWPRVSCAFDYAGSLRFQDDFEIRLGVTQIGKKSMTYAAQIVRDNQVLAQGHSTCACCEIGQDGHLRATPVPTDIIEKLQPYLIASTVGEADKDKDKPEARDS
jgi:acyl-CoA thioester hydrolase